MFKSSKITSGGVDPEPFDKHSPMNGVKPQRVYVDNNGTHSLWSLMGIKQVLTMILSS